MKFEAALRQYETIVENAPLGTRLRYDYGLETPFNLTDSETGKKALLELYAADIVVAQEHQIPIIINAPTYRASRNHLLAAGYKGSDVKRINASCIDFIRSVKNNYEKPGMPIFLGAPLGSMYDAYDAEILVTIEDAREYHCEQISVCKEKQADFLNVVTLPTLAEAQGVSLAAQDNDMSYTIGFVLSDNATLLDGNSLEVAIDTIDRCTTKKPLGYLITCTHSSVVAKLTQAADKYSRLIGVQLNGSNLSLKAREGLQQSEADPPNGFARALIELKEKLGLKIIGGCCGTTTEHLRRVVELCSESMNHYADTIYNNGT